MGVRCLPEGLVNGTWYLPPSCDDLLLSLQVAVPVPHVRQCWKHAAGGMPWLWVAGGCSVAPFWVLIANPASIKVS